MLRHHRASRTAFSLLEMVLSLALAMVLMLALYLTLNTYWVNATAGRDTLADGEISRSIMSRFSADITNHLGAYDSRSAPDYSSTMPAPEPTDPAASATPAPVAADTVKFNTGVVGDAMSVSLSVYRVEAQPAGAVANPEQDEVKSDLRRVDYWLVMNGSEVRGLARREVKLATGDEIATTPADLPDQEKFLIAREVKAVDFKYFDGQSWVDSWDGSAPFSLERPTPIGPPAAIKITLTVRRSVNKLLMFNTETEAPDLVYTHVVALPGSNNFTPKTTSP